MRRRFHIPAEVQILGMADEAEAARLERAVLSALRRALEGLGLPAAEIIETSGDGRDRDARGPFSSADFRPDRGTYAVPSYEQGGAPTEVPVTEITFEEEEVEPVTSTLLLHPSGEASEDRVITGRSPFEGDLIAIFPRWEAVRVRSERYAVVSELRRAVLWGQFLFGASSFVIIEGPFGRPGSRYYVLDTTHALRAPEAVRGSGFQLEGGEVFGIGGRIHWVTEFQDEEGRSYFFRALFTSDDKPLFPPNIELAQEFYTQVALSPPERGTIPTELARAHVFAEIDRLIESGETEAAARRLAALDAHAFALVEWEIRVRYVRTLIEAWTHEPQQVAIVEIIKSLESPSQLRAVLGRLRQEGVFDDLFSNLDSQIWSLLVEVGQRFGDREPLTFDDLVEFLREARLVPSSVDEIAAQIALGPLGPVFGPDLFAQLEEAARSFVRFLGGSLEAAWMLITEPEKVVEGIAQLVKLAAMAQLAQLGYPPAQEFVGNIIQQMSQRVILGLKGARILGVTSHIVRRIEWAIIWEVASWFVGIGEIRTALASVGITRRVAALGRITWALRLAGQVAEVERVVSKLDDLARLLSRTGLVAQQDDIVRLLSHLPEEDVARLGRALESANVSDVQDFAQLAARHPELADVADQTLRRVEALSALEVSVGRLSDNLVQGFQRLASRSGFSSPELFNLMSAIPAENAELFMRTVQAMPTGAFGRGVGTRSLNFFQNLANHPRSMQFLIDASYDTFSTLYRQSGYNIVRFEENLDALSDIARRLPPGTSEVEYQRFLDRLRNEDPAALSDLRDARNALRAAAGRPPIRSFSPAELDDIVRTTPDIRYIRELVSQMDNSTAGSLFERWVNHYVFHQPVGAPRTRLSVRRGNNPHLNLERDRSSDFFLNDDGSLWDAKIYQSGGEIDVFQLDDYRRMEEASFVVTGDGQRRNVASINYVFSDRAAAEANRSLLHVQGGAEAWFIDDRGVLQHLN